MQIFLSVTSMPVQKEMRGRRSPLSAMSKLASRMTFLPRLAPRGSAAERLLPIPPMGAFSGLIIEKTSGRIIHSFYPRGRLLVQVSMHGQTLYMLRSTFLCGVLLCHPFSLTAQPDACSSFPSGFAPEEAVFHHGQGRVRQNRQFLVSSSCQKRSYPCIGLLAGRDPAPSMLAYTRVSANSEARC